MKKLLLVAGIAGSMLTSCMISQTYQLTGAPIGTKTGVAKTSIIGDSDHSISTAAKNGGIKVIGAVEITTKQMVIFPVTKTKVYGN